jgi:hypothetical protein
VITGLNKLEILEKLSKINEVVFVGGTSEYIQGIKDNLNDIDISINNIEPLKEFGYVFKGFDDSFYGLSGNRAFIPLDNVLIDIFIDDVQPEFTIINGFKCETIQSMIMLRENSLKYTFNGSFKNRLKLITNLERLKNIPTD